MTRDKHYFDLLPGESLRLGPDVLLTFVDVRQHTKAKIGVSADESIPVVRAELLSRLTAGKEGAA